jgi:hypothetical protein
VSLLLDSEHRPRDKEPFPVDAKRRLPSHPAPPLSSLLLPSLARPRRSAAALLPVHWSRRDRGDLSR